MCIRDSTCGDDPEALERFERFCAEHGYDRKEPLSWLIYVDATSLYPYAMTFPLPVGGYKKLEVPSPEELDSLMFRYDDLQEDGYFVDVSIFIPEQLHDKFDSAPVKSMTVPDELLSKHTLGVREKLGCSGGSQKMMPYLGEHEKVLHHIALLKL